MKVAYWSIVISLLAISCKKNGNSNADTGSGTHTDTSSGTISETNTFHKNVIIHETIKTSELPQQGLGLFQTQDPKKILFTAGRANWEPEGRGFRIGSLIKDSGCAWIRSYFLSDSYRYQLANCSVFDKNQYTWVAGNWSTEGPTAYIRPFIAKLNTNGEIVWSKSLESTPAIAGRSAAMSVLKNGDLAYLTTGMNTLTLYRMRTDGTIIWAKTITHNLTPTLLGYLNYYNKNQTLAEGADGSIYMAIDSKAATDNKNVLIKISSTGALAFAKSYSYLPTLNLLQAHIICLNDGRIIYGDNKDATKGIPSFLVIAADGSLQASFGLAENSSPSSLFITELQYHNNSLYLATYKDYQVNMYKVDASFNALSSVKMFNSSYQLSAGGGLSLFDADSSCWYHMLNFTGSNNTGNGFQYIKTKEDGTSCHIYPEGPEKFQLQSIPVTILNEAGVTIKDATLPSFQDLSWQSATVTISAQEKVCAN
jgi:hypothetical protein